MKNSNKFNQFFALSILSILTLSLTNCGSSTNAGGGSDSDNSQGVEITSANTVVANSTLNLAATLTFATTTTPTFIWTIRGNTTFASINGNTLTGIAPGEITLVATYGTRTGTQKFTVTPAPPVPLAAPTALKAVATGVANQVRISWTAVAGATGYKVYQSASDLSGLAGGNPANLPTASATSTEVTTAFADIILSGTARTYFLATSVNNGVESTATSAVQTVATAHPLTFRAVAGGTAGTPTGTVWMDRNLGAGQVATASDDAMAYGNYYQWGRAADGHQVQTPTTTATLASSVTPNHADFITVTTGDWLASSVNDNRTIRSAFWSRTDGSSICPTGFRVPTIDELEAEIPSWSSENVAGAFASNLKWTAASFRNLSTGLLANDSTGIYWSSTPHANISESQVLFFGTHARDGLVARANGASVRCIQN